MFAIYAIELQPEHNEYSLTALFTTELNAYKFLVKLKDKFPERWFEILEWHEPVIDPKEVNEVFPS